MTFRTLPLKFVTVFRTVGLRSALIKSLAKVLGVSTVTVSPHVLPKQQMSTESAVNTNGLPTHEDAGSNHPRYKLWREVLPLPTPRLMQSVGASDVENFFVVADAWAQIISRRVKPHATVLDIGCGCARTARILTNNPFIEKYIGFDVIKPSIEWNNRVFTPLWGERFSFYHYDLYSKNYNPTGSILPRDLRFPAPDGSVSLAFAASLFTHVLEADAVHYLTEIQRVLEPGGVSIVSIHTKVTHGAQYSGDEYRIDINPDYFCHLAKSAGLQLKEHLGELCGQDTMVFMRC